MMRYLLVLMLSMAVVMFSECCLIDSAVSETEVLEWLDNPEASLRDLKQETEDLDSVDSPLKHFSDVRHAETNQEFVPLQIKKIEQVPAKGVKSTDDPFTISPILMPKEEQAPEQVPQEEQKLAEFVVKPVDEQRPEQIPVDGNKPEEEKYPENAPLVSQDQQKSEGKLPIEEKKFDQITHQHHHASPTPPASTQVENIPDQGPVVLELPGAEKKPEPVLVEEQKPDEVPAPKEKKPEQVQVEETEMVPAVSWQVPVDEPQPGQVPVENTKPGQVFFEQQQPENSELPVEQQKSEQVVGTEMSNNTQVDPVKKQVPSTTSPVSVQTRKPNRISTISFNKSGCFWSGTAPFCQGKCGKFYRPKVINKMGDGKTCLIGVKKLCCPISLTSLIG